MIVYPATGYNSFISVEDAETYFSERLYSSKFTAATEANQTAALVTAFHSISELDITIDPTESDQLQAVKNAQCEQALYELSENLDFQNLSSFDLMGIKTAKKALPRYSQRALAILKPYMKAPVIKATR